MNKIRRYILEQTEGRHFQVVYKTMSSQDGSAQPAGEGEQIAVATTPDEEAQGVTTILKAGEILQREGVSQVSSPEQWAQGTFYRCIGQPNPTTGTIAARDLYPVNFTPEEEQQIWQLVKQSGVA